jgi:hypothetical protein
MVEEMRRGGIAAFLFREYMGFKIMQVETERGKRAGMENRFLL